MNIIEKIETLCNEKGITIAALERACDLSNGSIRRWNTNVPSIDKIAKVADFFGVSLDYLTDREYKDVINDLDLRKIERARNKMSQEKREKMMKILEVSFDEYFNDED